VTAGHGLGFGPRLVATATGTLRAAIMIRPSPAIERATPLIGEPGAIYARAREQHGVLRATLESFGVETIVSEPHGSDPFEVNVGDAAVIFEDGAALMRLTPPSRRAEADRLEAELTRLDVALAGHIVAPGFLDGNDVLLAGRTAFVGRGERGNELGRQGFAALARAHGYEIRDVQLAPGVPALRAVAGAVAEDVIVLAPDKVNVDAFEGFRTIALERGEEQAAGVLTLGERHVIAEIRFRTALSAMRRAGVTVEALDLYEFTKLGITPSMLALALRRE
jgi:N-dimethylarginine dimethylaminohydrolase